MDIEISWAQAIARQGNAAALTGRNLQAIISDRVRKEFKAAAEFVWAAIVYQLILYSFLTHTIVRNWGNWPIIALCLAGAALYIPLTVTLIRKTQRLFAPYPAQATIMPSVLANVEAQYIRLADFFRFKQRMDWIGVPISCAIIVLVTFTLFVPGGLQAYPLAALGLFVLWVGMSLIAIRFENQRHFTAPLRQLEGLIQELKEPTAAES